MDRLVLRHCSHLYSAHPSQKPRLAPIEASRFTCSPDIASHQHPGTNRIDVQLRSNIKDLTGQFSSDALAEDAKVLDSLGAIKKACTRAGFCRLCAPSDARGIRDGQAPETLGDDRSANHSDL
jgi:hypothetical protein